MDIEKESLTRIKDLLKTRPRGMNVTEIAREIGVNRLSVSKYLEMMIMAGQVEVKNFGPSKVYFSSQRLPVSAMLSLSSDLILLLDRDLNIVNVNDRFLKVMNYSRDDVINKNIRVFSFPIRFDPDLSPFIKEALDGTESRIEAVFADADKAYDFSIKVIPMVFDDGKKGVTVLLEDITERKRIDTELQQYNDILEHRVLERTQELKEAKARAELYLDLIVHDINNTNQILMNYLEMARESCDDKGQQELLDEAIAAVWHSVKKIDDVRTR